MTKQGTIHLTYWREYYDSEESGYDAWFKIYYTLFEPLKPNTFYFLSLLDSTLPRGLIFGKMNVITVISGVDYP